MRRRGSVPMNRIIAFAIFSTRRQDEIWRLLWADLDQATTQQSSGILVRQMKNLGDDGPIDRWCELTPDALAIVQAMPRIDRQIFPYSSDAISSFHARMQVSENR